MSLVAKTFSALGRTRLLQRSTREAPLTRSVAAWVEEHEEGSVQRLPPAVPRPRTPPRALDDLCREPLAEWEPKSILSRHLVELHGATLFGRDAFLILPDGSYSLESVWIEPQLRNDPAYLQRFRLPAQRLAGSWFALFCLWTREHYHWLHDVVLRLHHVLERLPPDVRFLIPHDLKPSQLEALQPLGIEPARLTPYDGSRPMKPERLFWATPSAWTGNSSPAPVAWLRELCLEQYGEAEEDRRRIYISRARTKARRLVNEEELLPILGEWGFSVHHLETLSLAEQVRLLRSAEVVFAPHGAGLTSLLFCRPGTRVLELFSAGNIRGHYYALSDAAGLDYWCLAGEAKANLESDPDIYLAPEKLRRALEAVSRGI